MQVVTSMRNEATQSLLNHVLVLAAPSGAGKSTFLSQMSSRELPEDIASKLPNGAEKWLLLSAGRHQLWFPLVLAVNNRKPLPGVVLEYDITRDVALRGQYGDDPILLPVKVAKTVTVVNLIVPHERIINQLGHRETGAPSGRTSALSLLRIAGEIGRHVVSAMAAGLPPNFIIQFRLLNPLVWSWNVLHVRVDKDRSGKLLRRLSGEAPDAGLGAIYARWQAYIELLRLEGIAIRQIFLKPDPSRLACGKDLWQVESHFVTSKNDDRGEPS